MELKETLFISGLLRQRMLSHYQTYIRDFDTSSLTIANPETWETFNFTYYGEIKNTSSKFIEKLATLQEIRINEGIKEIKDLTQYHYGVNSWTIHGQKFNIYGEVNTIINQILQDKERRYSFLLLTYLFKIIKNINILEIKDVLANYSNLIDYLAKEGDLLNQIELDLILNKFLNDKYFFSQSIRYELPNLKKQYFQIDEQQLDLKMQKILLLGEFVAPKRVVKIAQDMYQQDNKSALVALIYFLVPNMAVCQNFLWLLHQEKFDTETLMEYLDNNNQVSNHTKTLIRKNI